MKNHFHFLELAISTLIGVGAHAQVLENYAMKSSPIYFGENDQEFSRNETEFNFENHFACKKASAAQLAEINKGNAKTNLFLEKCAASTGGSRWCQQVIRPNPDSLNIFQCTYGNTQVHRLIQPNESTWTNAFKAIQLVEQLEAQNIKASLIYNWWRPEPYNANVGGVPGRHPFGTSVDVRFCTMSDMENAFTKLCEWRAEGQLRAVGYYGSTALHFGIGDGTGNTWGKECPKLRSSY